MISQTIVLLQVRLSHDLTRNKHESLSFNGHELTGAVASLASLVVQPWLFCGIGHFKFSGPTGNVNLYALAIFVVAEQAR